MKILNNMKYVLVVLLLLLSTSGKLQQTSEVPRPQLEQKLDNFNIELIQLKNEINSYNTTISRK